MDKYEDNSEDNLLKTVQKNIWHSKLASFMSDSPFYNGEDSRGVELLFEKLGDAIEQGNSCINTNQIQFNCSEIVQNYQLEPDSYKPIVQDGDYLYLQRYWSLEHQFAQALEKIISQKPIQSEQDADYSDLFEDPHQQAALKKGITLPFCIITGGPGTGKTYILTRIVAVLKALNPRLRIAMAAPTGKAAQRMQEALQNAFSDPALLDAGLYHPDFKQQQTQTLHRLLGMGNRQIAKFNQDNPLPYDVVVVDEASMLDLSLAKALFSAISSSTRLILLGDANQLSSVDVGHVLADLQQVPQLEVYHQALSQSRRFSDNAKIGRFAKYIYQGRDVVHQHTDVFNQASHYADFSLEQWKAIVEPVQIKDATLDVELEKEQDWVGYFEISEQILDHQIDRIYTGLAQGFNDYVIALKKFKSQEIDKHQLVEAFDRYRILVAIKHGPLGLSQINKIIAEWMKRALQVAFDAEWYLGRPVMMTYNDYQIGLSNGDIGICLAKTSPTSGELSYHVYFPSLDREIPAARLPQSIQTAYALTIHKSQGSEFRHVAVVLDEHAEQLLSKELIYTGITRAKKMVSIYANQRALELSFKTKTHRQSGLPQQIERILAK